MPDIASMLDHIRRISDSLPDRIPTALHVGPHVLNVLKQATAPERGTPAYGLPAPFGTPIIADASMSAGSWRIVDQYGQELHAGNLWPPHLPVHETEHLPADTAAVIYTPPDGFAPFAGEACVFVRATQHPHLNTEVTA